MSCLKSITIRGFRSIRALEGFEPGGLAVLIGANGAGKSNFVEFFRMLRSMADGAFQRYAQFIGPETVSFRGPKQTPSVAARLEFGDNIYEFDLRARAGGGLFLEERVQYTGGKGLDQLRPLGPPSPESHLRGLKDEPGRTGSSRGVPGYIHDSISSWSVYHVHDTSPTAPLRGWSSVSNNVRLEPDARNLAALLMSLKLNQPSQYRAILQTIQLAAPFLDDFVFRPQVRGPEEQVRLEWTQLGSQEPFQPTVLSDGTIRFIALVTALLQPSPPAAIVIDEPELGLHPFAINLLGEAVRAAAARTQVFVATQSPQLLDSFEPGEVVVVERRDGASEFRRLDATSLREWLAEYSMGELWMKNLLGGRPACD